MLDCLSQHECFTSATEQRYASSSMLDAECARLGRTWLSASELAELAARRNPHRKQEWLRSRMLAKQLIASGLPMRFDWQQIEILRQGESRRPRVLIRGDEQPWSLSISHSAQGVLVALSRQPAATVGVDLTDREPLRPSFVRLWFTAAEVAWLRDEATPFAANMIWATKEAIFKACNHAEGFDPRQIEVLSHRNKYRGEPIDCEVQRQIVDDQIAVVVTVHNTHSSFTVS